MRRYLGILFAALIGMIPAQGLAANSTVPAMTAAGAVSDTDLFYCVQGAGTTDRKCTPVQLATYLFGKFSGDATANSTGTITLKNTGPGATGPIGSATVAPIITIDAQGRVTVLSSATVTPAVGSITGLGTGVGTALGVNVGTAGAFVVLNGAGGTPSSMTLTNATGLPIGGITGLGTGVASALAAALNASAGLIGALTPTNGNCTVGNGAAWTSAACPGGTAANPTATAGPTAVNGVATTYMRSDGAPAIQQGSASVKGIVQVDGTTITATGGVITAVGGGSSSAVPNTQSGTNYAFQGTDLTKIINLSNASNQIPTIAQAGTGSFTTGWYTTACNIGAGTQTITPATSTIGGASTYVLPAGSVAAPKCIGLVSDGTNYVIVPDFTVDASTLTAGTLAAARGGAGAITGALKGNGSGVVSQAACADLSNGTALCSTTPGTGVATAAAAALSAAGGLTTTIATGTSALGTGAITSATCATVVTTTATNVATTDVVLWGFNGDPTAVTGYVPLVSGMLTIIAYPSSGNVNFKVCNNTNASVTPGAITLNWSVRR